ncbi:MAG: hypothetical protein A2096_05775 [Spirochaetes bacterium GWF1_41_5]|nr:MAG: hypothetical protein A2096_05775 [Spirochaetes bacterium GWF1_41_5]
MIIEKMIKKIPDYAKQALVISILLSVFLFLVMKKNSRMETDLDKYMPQNHPAFVFSSQAEEWFQIRDGIIIAVENKEGIYSPHTLQKVKDLTIEIQNIKEIGKDDVTSLYTAENIIGSDDGMTVKSFYNQTPQTAGELDNLKKLVRNNEMVNGRIVSQSETVTIIIAKINNDLYSEQLYEKFQQIAEKYKGPENIYIAGRPIVEGVMAKLGPRDMQKMVPVVILIIVFTLLLVLRSVRAAFFTLLVVLLSTVWSYGLMALFSIPVYSVSTMIPVMLIAIGVADGIHMYTHLRHFTLAHPEAGKKDAVLDMLKNMWKPVIMTSLTTAIGFISLVSSEVYPIKYFGIFTAAGVMMAMIFSLVLIPAGIMILGLPHWKARPEESKTSLFDRILGNFIAEKIIKYKYATIIATAAVIAVSIAGISKVWINSSFLEKFEKDSEIVLTDRFINSHFGGTSTLNVVLSSETEGAFKNPEVLKIVDSLQQAMEKKLDFVGNSFSLADYLKRMNKVMHADAEEYNSVPAQADLIAQYLLLYEMSGDPDNLWQTVDYNYQKLNIVFQLKSDNSKSMHALLDEIKIWLPEFSSRGIEVKYAGSGYKSLVFVDLILSGQIMSVLISLVMIILLLTAMFRNLYIGLIGSLPIMISSLTSFGLMGLLDIPLENTTALISSIAIGIGIDYSIHFIERYKNNALEFKDKKLASLLTVNQTGKAILFNALVVIAGFMVLLLSAFPRNRNLGALVSLNMFTSLIGTLTIMFLVMYMSNIYFKKK